MDTAGDPSRSDRSLAGRSLDWPTWRQLRRVLLLQDYNTRVVVLGTTLLGCAAAMVGSFTLLRKRALMGDALSHATLPGIALAFILATLYGGDGKALPVLLVGATISGLLGVATILVLRSLTRLKEDTAIGAVLSVYFGAGVALLSIVQQMREGNAAGLESFIYGKTASMGRADIRLIATAAAACIAGCVLLFKELKLLCFDDAFAGSRGFPVRRLDITLMALVVIVTIVGLQAVGLILMIALLIIPAAAARFWTERLGRMFLISGALGAASGWLGASVSAVFSKLPSGAMIVLVCTAMFAFSMAFGSARGVAVRAFKRRRLNRSIDRQHLLRGLYELLEESSTADDANAQRHEGVRLEALLRKRSWSRPRLLRQIRRCQDDLLVQARGNRVRLTRRGVIEARRLTRQHRLWELFLIHYADVAPSHVDRDADAIEHVLEPEIIEELEAILSRSGPALPASPHRLDQPDPVPPAEGS
ncbi:metal ABC transporter permease [Roseimaritima sediminicola]|uniref:metal ABC transporter permease n=1 Tax=Roseimaritima sediminicola TaxID=2662066 RepID=UPI001EEF4876|nr:iron chelate uptake ABC transporter family permease subunit [Roseimaritima sediminicola]